MIARILAAITIATTICSCTAIRATGIGDPSGFLGTGVGNWQVSDTERAALNAVRPGLGDLLAQNTKKPERDPLDRAEATVMPWQDATGYIVVWPLTRVRTKVHIDAMPAPKGSALPDPAATNAPAGQVIPTPPPAPGGPSAPDQPAPPIPPRPQVPGIDL